MKPRPSIGQVYFVINQTLCTVVYFIGPTTLVFAATASYELTLTVSIVATLSPSFLSFHRRLPTAPPAGYPSLSPRSSLSLSTYSLSTPASRRAPPLHIHTKKERRDGMVLARDGCSCGGGKESPTMNNHYKKWPHVSIEWPRDWCRFRSCCRRMSRACKEYMSKMKGETTQCKM